MRFSRLAHRVSRGFLFSCIICPVLLQENNGDNKTVSAEINPYPYPQRKSPHPGAVFRYRRNGRKDTRTYGKNNRSIF